MIVVGGSLGGFNAVQSILAHLPLGFQIPVAIVLHRNREPGSLLQDGLQRHCALPIVEVEDKEPVEPGHVYLGPPDYHLLVERTHFALSADEPVNYARPSIDVLFESAADAFGVALIGVVLTGASQDGARGAARIQDRGGIVIVQDPASAERPEMPAAALAAAPMSQVQPLEQIASTLLRMGGHVLPGTP